MTIQALLLLVVTALAAADSFAQVNCAAADDDSFWVKMDDGAFVVANGLRTSGWDWVELVNADRTPGETADE